MSSGQSVILIDPDAETRNVLIERLRMQGYKATGFAGPVEGANAALGSPPSAVIADLWMEGISGVQLTRLLRAEPATERVPVILRGPDSPRNRFWAERAGAAAYVVKGRMGELVRAIARAIVTDPTILVADEPTGDLDRVSAEEILDMMERLNTEMGKTIIMVTHDQDLAKEAKRTIQVFDGGIKSDTVNQQ